MSVRRQFVTGLGVAVGGALFAAAWSESPARLTSSPIAPSGASSAVRAVDLNMFEICKDYSGTPGPSVVFNITIDVGDNGSIDITKQQTLAGGQCAEIHTTQSLSSDRVNVTEVVPAGYTASWVKTQQIGGNITTTSGTGNSAFGFTIHTDGGGLIIFTNTRVEEPPAGGEGCTPGYWKNHTDVWQGFSSGQDFDTAFGLGTPGLFTPNLTLLAALKNGGGGFDKLGRHAVAALLSAAHSDVDYAFTTTQIINAVKAAVAAGNPEPLATSLERENERGCPLDKDGERDPR
jgi:hypothetical protein